MDRPTRKTFGLISVVIVLFSVYVTFIQTVNLGFAQAELIKSLMLTDLAESGPSQEFRIGDTLVVVVETELANAYTVEIYDDSSLVYSANGAINASPTKVPVLLVPQVFHAGKWYMLTFYAHVNNYPLPGGEIWNWEGLEIFSDIGEEILTDIALDFIGLFGSYVLAKSFGMANVVAAVLTEIGKFFAQLALLYISWENKMKLLGSAIASFLMAFVGLQTRTAEAFLKALQTIVWTRAMSALYLISYKMIVAAQPIQAYRTLVDWLEVGLDFSVGGFALLRYLGRI